MDHSAWAVRHRLDFANRRTCSVRTSPAGAHRQSASHADRADVRSRETLCCARFPARSRGRFATTGAAWRNALSERWSRRLRPTSVTRALVTGGSGFIGQHLVTALLAQGREVRILDLHRPASAQQAQYVNGSVLDPELVEEALIDVEEVYHLAGLPGMWTTN